MKWTTREVARLRELARTMPVVDIVLMFPGRSYDSVVDAAKRHGISLQTPRGLVYCHECGEFRTKAPCPVCRERAKLEREQAQVVPVQDMPDWCRARYDLYQCHLRGSRVDPVPPVPDYKGPHDAVRAQCMAREAAQIANISRVRKAMAKRRERMTKKAVR